ADQSEKIYCVNTYLGYHIDRNDRRIFYDNILGKFDEITRLLKDDSQFFNILKDNGFRYILYELSTPGIDQTPEQSLREKGLRLINLLIKSPKVKLVATDNYVKDSKAPLLLLPDGQTVQARPGLVGKVAYLGSFGLFEIQ
ncbi:MAG: hypothetical protein AAGG75_05705, partial [Bacteroidota bacterium]